MSESQYVVFKIEKVEYGVSIYVVTEIINYQESIRIPNSEDHVKGVINYRGKVVPLIDLKKRLINEETEITEHTRILIIMDEEQEIGFIIDEVTETMRLKDELIEKSLTYFGGVDEGIGKIDEKRLIVLLDVERLLSNDEKIQVEDELKEEVLEIEV